MKVSLVGCWDGVNLWLQWDDVDPAAGYQVEVSFRRSPKPGGTTPDWEPWQRTGGLQPLRRPWMVIRTHREGSAARARVALFGAAEWQNAGEALFERSTCLLEIRSEQRRVHYQTGTEFHGVVDGAGACYRIDAEVEVQPGQSVQVSAQAVDPSGFHQLDHPGHFLLRPALGLSISNVAASENDLIDTGRDFTVLSPIRRTTPLRVFFGPTNHFDGSSPAVAK